MAYIITLTNSKINEIQKLRLTKEQTFLIKYLYKYDYIDRKTYSLIIEEEEIKNITDLTKIKEKNLTN